MNEFELIRKYFERPAKGALVGVGDDCALVRPNAGLELAMTTDTLVEGRHFAAGAEARSLGHKALAVNLSDLAAMGAAPRWALLSLALPSADEAWLAAFSGGFFALAERHGIELVGGDTVRSPLLTIGITAIGEVPAGVTMYRGSARPGDDVWVSGELGGAALALKHPEVAEAAERLHRPEPRVELGERLRGIARAAIDVSDGFAADLGHILQRSGVCAVVYYEQLPRAAALARFEASVQQACVLGGGDDYELCFTADPERRKEVEALSRELGLRLSLVGSIQKGEPRLHLYGEGGRAIEVPAGFDHFR